MGRWTPDARGRMAAAAYELYAEQGYEATTGAQIAARAGLSERTFFRHFPDKRAVPFHGVDALVDRFRDLAAAAPADLSPLAAARTAVLEQCAVLQEVPEHARLRHEVVAASDDLRERDLLHHARLVAALEEGLAARGVPALEARLAGEAAVVGLRVAVERWLAAGQHSALPAVYAEVMDRLGDVVLADPTGAAAHSQATPSPSPSSAAR